jgi:hypothetical protein
MNDVKGIGASGKRNGTQVWKPFLIFQMTLYGSHREKLI